MDEKTLMSQVGARLKTLRHSLNLTQAQIAEQIDRSQREVSFWEKGKKLVPLIILFKIRDIYGVPLGYFDPKDETYVGQVLGQALAQQA